jgi:hypothetical protein
VIIDILDLAAARRTPTAAYEWTLQGFQAGAPAPKTQ